MREDIIIFRGKKSSMNYPSIWGERKSLGVDPLLVVEHFYSGSARMGNTHCWLLMRLGL
jgi:hypothetical protein